MREQIIKNERNLEEKEKRFNEINLNILFFKRKHKDLSIEIQNLRTKLDSLKKKRKPGDKEIIISEHAYIRFLERAFGVKLKDIADQIIPENTMALIKKMGDGKYPTKTHTVVVKDGVVTTVLPPN